MQEDGAQETRPLPSLALTAFGLMRAAFQRDLQTLGGQILDAVGLPASEWGIDYDRGVVYRHTPPVEANEPETNGTPPRFAEV